MANETGSTITHVGRSVNRPHVRYIAARGRSIFKGAPLRRAIAWTVLASLTVVAGGLAFGVWQVKKIAEGLPSVSNIADLKLNTTTTIVTSDGVLLATIQTENRHPVGLDEISPLLIRATIATEDARFYTHGGIDPRGIARALFTNLRHANATSQGASTITQQLARNLYLSSEKSYRRKIEEMLLARRIETEFSKREILEAYLNSAYYGSGCYGIEAAARGYFGVPAAKLTLAQAALLAGVPQRPAMYSPAQHFEAAIKRRNTVLDRMIAVGALTAAEAAPVRLTRPLVSRPQVATNANWRAPYFVQEVVNRVRSEYGADYLYSGLRIVTTLNWKMQQAAERSLHAGLRGGSGPNTGALVSLDPRSGYVRAMVGGADFGRDQYNAATQGERQPGSAFKPLVYAAAFDTSVCDISTVLNDEKLVFDTKPTPWTVHNYEKRYRGPVTVLDAIRDSINTIAVQVIDQTTPETAIDYAHRLGITSTLQPVLPLALGASAVHPIDLCSAYTAFANGGGRYEPTVISRITDALGRDTYRDEPGRRFHAAFMSPMALDQINAALREVVLHGTGSGAAAIPDAHGKTGTTSSRRDAWFVGYTSDLATAVWAAHAKVERTIRNHNPVQMVRYSPMPCATGGRVCAPIWRGFMAAAIPVQQHVDALCGISRKPIAADGADELLAMIRSAGKPTTLGQKAEADSVQIAEDGSSPVQVTAAEYQPQPQSAVGSEATAATMHLHRSFGYQDARGLRLDESASAEDGGVPSGRADRTGDIAHDDTNAHQLRSEMNVLQ